MRLGTLKAEKGKGFFKMLGREYYKLGQKTT